MKRILTLCSLMAGALAALAQYTIYPVPQKMTAQSGTAQFSENVCIVPGDGIDAATIERAQQVLKDHGLTGNVSNTAQQCNSVIYLKVDPSVAVAKKFDAHTISLKAQGDGMASLTITGEHTTAAFYGLASLEQMLDEKGTVDLPCVEIQDYADQLQRGLVEGYYGYPYSVDVKKDLMRYMMRLKMNTYLYGAKSDPYHSSKWKDPYPTSITKEQEEGGWLSQDMVRDICQVSAQTKVNFIWAIHPGNNFVGSSTVVNDIMGKFKNMHSLGVRQFAVFVDDVSIPSSEADMKTNADRLTSLQRTIESTFNGADKAPTDTVRPLHFVPQIYCRGFAGSEEQFNNFFKALSTTPEYITVYTTGWGVWSVPNVSDYNVTATPLGREVAWWWNYPCNDNTHGELYPMDMYQNFTDHKRIGTHTLPADMQNRGMGIVSNPMQQGEVSKTALFSVADYAWHCAGFKNKDSWEASFRFVLPNKEYAEAYRTLAPYLICNDPSSGTSAITASLTQANAEKRIKPLIEACQQLMTMKDSEVDGERLLWTDLSPWVLHLHDMLTTTLELYNTKAMANTKEDGSLNEDKWNAYTKAVALIDDMAENEKYITKSIGWDYTKPTSYITIPASKTLAPAMESLKTSAIKGFVPTRNTRPAYFTNTDLTSAVSTNTSGTKYYYFTITARTYPADSHIGMTLPETRLVTIAAADTLYNGREIRVSADGKEWTVLAKGQQPASPVRHIMIANVSGKPQSTQFTKNNFTVTPVPDPTISSVTVPSGDEYGGHEKKYLTDGDYDTWFTMNANQKTGDTYTLNLSSEAPLSIVRVGIGTTNGDYMATGRIEISTDGTTWTKLSPVGKTKNTFTIDDMTKYSDECKTLDFDGKGKYARYIRLYNQTANTNKWLRIFEMQPFYATVDAEVVNSKGTALMEAYDGLPYTGVVPTGSSLTIKLPYINDVQSITLLTSEGIEVIDMSQTPQASNYEFTWTGAAPRIYEIFATVSDKKADTNGVERITLLPSTSSCYDLQGRSHAGMPKAGLYIVNGKKYIK